MGKKEVFERKVIAFLGTGCERYARFATALIASARPQGNILVWDASTCKALFVGTVGAASEQTVWFRSVVYTVDTEYAHSHMDEYEVVIIADDFVVDHGSFGEYESVLDYVYLCMSANRYALEVMLRIGTCIVGKDFPISYIFCGTMEDVVRWKVRNYWKYLQNGAAMDRKVFFIPFCESDIQSALRLEYGLFRMKDLSQGIHELFFDLSDKLQIDSNVMQGIEQSTMFST